MNLDDRLSAAHKQRLAEAHDDFDQAGRPPFQAPRRRAGAQLVAAAAAVIVLAIGVFALSNSQSEPEPLDLTVAPVATTVTDDDGSDRGERTLDDGDDIDATTSALDEPTPTAPPTPAPTPSPTPTAVPDPPTRPDDAAVAVPDPTATPAVEPTPTQPPAASPTPEPIASPTALPAATATSTPTATPTPTPEPTATSTPTPTAIPEPTPAYATGVANAVCPSGSRAELEFASLRYVGENTGWGRLGDLVDEQDGPFYFETWEPGYPLPVTVEVALTQPVLATELRIAQDPFTEVAGSVDFSAGTTSFSLTMSGVDGWQVHTFAEPTVIERFTITRDQPSENVMEVLICVTQ